MILCASNSHFLVLCFYHILYLCDCFWIKNIISRLVWSLNGILRDIPLFSKKVKQIRIGFCFATKWHINYNRSHKLEFIFVWLIGSGDNKMLSLVSLNILLIIVVLVQNKQGNTILSYRIGGRIMMLVPSNEGICSKEKARRIIGIPNFKFKVVRGTFCWWQVWSRTQCSLGDTNLLLLNT